MFPLPWLTLLKFGLPAIAIGLVYFWGIDVINNYGTMETRIAQLQHQLDLNDGRINSYLRMIDRRDRAIETTTCKARIQYLITHPDQLPTKTDPFNSGGGG